MAKRKRSPEEVSESFSTGVMGEFYDNTDGTSRQKILKRCKPGQQLHLICDIENPKHGKAVLVTTTAGQGIGYLPWDLAEVVAPEMMVDGWLYRVTLDEVKFENGCLNAEISASKIKNPDDEDPILDAFATFPQPWPRERARRRRKSGNKYSRWSLLRWVLFWTGIGALAMVALMVILLSA